MSGKWLVAMAAIFGASILALTGCGGRGFTGQCSFDLFAGAHMNIEVYSRGSSRSSENREAIIILGRICAEVKQRLRPLPEEAP